jgi:hypothetical protein
VIDAMVGVYCIHRHVAESPGIETPREILCLEPGGALAFAVWLRCVRGCIRH